MHLALVISGLSTGGAERALSELASYWARKGHQVSLVTLASPEAQPYYSLHPKINLIQLDRSQVGYFSFLRLINIFLRVFALRRVIRDLNPDVVVSFVDVMNITTLIALWKMKLPVIVSERSHPAFHQLPELYRRIRQRLYPRATYVVTQTKSAAAYFKEFTTNLVVIPNAVHRPVHIKELTQGKVREIISVGRLCPFKGFDTLIYAFSNIINDYPSLILTIYGEGKERSKVEQLICSLGLQDKVSLLGTRLNIYEALAKADLFVFPSHYEGFPNALCEAMAVGLPVIASACSGNVDIVRDRVDGRLFPIGNVDALTDIIRELLSDSEQLRRLGKNAQEVCNRFYPDHVFQQWDNLIFNAKLRN